MLLGSESPKRMAEKIDKFHSLVLNLCFTALHGGEQQVSHDCECKPGIASRAKAFRNV